MAVKRTVLDVLNGETVFPPPIWLMRQAGRYLPEYRATRAKAGSFLDLCYNPDLAVEVTLQPIRRFGFDASILFSDILVVPHALGRDLRFEEGRGPVMTPIQPEEIAQLDGSRFRESFTSLRDCSSVARRLAGGNHVDRLLWSALDACDLYDCRPWHARSGPARLFAYRNPQEMAQLLRTLAEYSADYLIRQIDAGVDVVQIFDSWSGVLDETTFEQCCIRPVRVIVDRVRDKYPSVPIIGFPRGAGALYDHCRAATGVTALGLDWTVPAGQAQRLQGQGPIQGNLDPLRLVAGGKALADGVDTILEALGRGPLVFNLGHGITPETPIEHVEAMIARIRSADHERTG
jgi:uroporphyrinogen decarboxylase